MTVTGAARSADGRKVVLRTYADAFEWDVPDGDIVKALTSGTPRVTPLADEFGEGIGFSADGSKYVTVSDVGSLGDDFDVIVKSYTPTQVVAKPAEDGPAGDEKSWLDTLSLQDITYLIGAVGVIGALLVGAGIFGIVRSRRAGGAKAGAPPPKKVGRQPVKGAAAPPPASADRRGDGGRGDRGRGDRSGPKDGGRSGGGVYGGRSGGDGGGVYGGRSGGDGGGVYGGRSGAGSGGGSGGGVYGGRSGGGDAGRSGGGGVYGGGSGDGGQRGGGYGGRDDRPGRGHPDDREWQGGRQSTGRARPDDYHHGYDERTGAHGPGYPPR